ncbi:hypothetical protein MHYP_G00061920 [Metynnis hypsauchen]
MINLTTHDWGLKEWRYEQGASAPVYDEVSTLAVTSEASRAASSDGQDDVQYSSVHFLRSQTKDVPLSSTVHPSHALREEEEVQYAAVNTAKSRTARKPPSSPDLYPWSQLRSEVTLPATLARPTSTRLSSTHGCYCLTHARSEGSRRSCLTCSASHSTQLNSTRRGSSTPAGPVVPACFP